MADGIKSINIREPDYLQLSFYHIAAKVEVTFHSFIEDFKDQYVSKWDNLEVYGRMDPIGSFGGTIRKISLSWKVPATSFIEAKGNMYKAQTLVSMLYPVYDHKKGKQPVLKASPLMKVRLGNLIIKAGTSPASKEGASKTGLVCSVGGFTFDPELEDGFFFQERGSIFPQTLKFNCEAQVYHDHPLGWDEKEIKGKVVHDLTDVEGIELRKRRLGFPYSSGRGGSREYELDRDARVQRQEKEIEDNRTSQREKEMLKD